MAENLELNSAEVIKKLALNGIIKRNPNGSYTFTSGKYFDTAQSQIKSWIRDSKIPFREKRPNGSFVMLTAITPYAKKYLSRLITSGEYSYDRIVHVTHEYYNNSGDTFKCTISKFMENGLLLGLLEENGTSVNLGNKTSL